MTSEGNNSAAPHRRDERIAAVCRTIQAAAPLLLDAEKHRTFAAFMRPAASRGFFRPVEDEAFVGWWSTYLTMRSALLEAVGELRPLVFHEQGAPEELTRLRAFIAGYVAAGLLVGAARTLIYDIAFDDVIRRKLNEGVPTHRIPRKQFTSIYRSLTSPRHLLRLHAARRFAEQHMDEIDAIANDEIVGSIVPWVQNASSALDVGKRRAAWARLEYRLHSFRWRRRSAWRRAMFELAEGAGCIIADLRNPFHRSRFPSEIRDAIVEFVEPGDVFVTRHHQVLSNLFLPGFWPHAALHLGSDAQRRGLGVNVPRDHAPRLHDPLRNLEARKDGVLFRTLEDTLAVDAVAVLRPRLDDHAVARSIERVIQHEGKLYNFDFDFSTADRLVCTEVIYRAFEGTEGIEFQLTERAGRPTLSAEDLIRMAMAECGFDAVALYGERGGALTDGDLLLEQDAADALRRHQRHEPVLPAEPEGA